MLYPSFYELVSIVKMVGGITCSNHVVPVVLRPGAVGEGSSSVFHGRGSEFKEVRQYIAGDDVRNIDWRVTARANKPHIKVFGETQEGIVYIISDMNSYMRFGTKCTFKSVQVARICAAVSWGAWLYGSGVGGCVLGVPEDVIKRFPVRKSKSSIYSMLRFLCQEGANETYEICDISLSKACNDVKNIVPDGSSIFVISDFMNLSEATLKAIKSLGTKGRIFLVTVNDIADSTLPCIGSILVNGGYGNDHLVDLSNEVVRSSYEQAWLDNRRILEELSCSLRARIYSITTTDTLGIVVSSMFSRNNKPHRRR